MLHLYYCNVIILIVLTYLNDKFERSHCSEHSSQSVTPETKYKVLDYLLIRHFTTYKDNVQKFLFSQVIMYVHEQNKYIKYIFKKKIFPFCYFYFYEFVFIYLFIHTCVEFYFLLQLILLSLSISYIYQSFNVNP